MCERDGIRLSSVVACVKGMASGSQAYLPSVVAWLRGMASGSQVSCLVEGDGIRLSSELPGGGGWHPALKCSCLMEGYGIHALKHSCLCEGDDIHSLKHSCLALMRSCLSEGDRVKGSLTRDFRLQVFFINQCPLGP